MSEGLVRGGGIVVYNGDWSTLSAGYIYNNQILSNTAAAGDTTGGAGLRLTYNVATLILSNTFQGNVIQGGGGAIDVFYGGATTVIKANLILSNTANYGSGISTNAWTLVDSNLLAFNSGASIALYGATSPITLVNNVIVHSGNEAVAIGDTNNASLVNNTIAFNTDGGVAVSRSTVRLRNSIVVSNTNCGVNVFGGVSTVTLEYNDFWGNTPANYCSQSSGTGDISADPLFVDAANGDYHIRYGSPAMNTGTNVDTPAFDKDGVSRPQGSGVDMGAYEVRVYSIYLPVALKNYPAVHHSFTDSTTSAIPSSNPSGYIYTGYAAPYATPRSIEIYWPLSSDIVSSTVGTSTFKFWCKGVDNPFTHLYVNEHDVGVVNVGTEYGWCTSSFYTAYLDQGSNNVIKIWTTSGYTNLASDAPEGDNVGQPNKYYIRNNGGTSSDWGPGYGKIYTQLTAEWDEAWGCIPDYKADFDGVKCDWYESDTANSKFGCLNGEYQILHKQPYRNGFTFANTLPTSKFALAADVRFVTNNGGAAGLTFGNLPYESYDFLIQPDSGVFGLYKSNGLALVSWQANAAINTYLVTNRLKVVRDGSAIRLYANNHLLTTVDDSSIQGAGIGVYSNSGAQGNVDTRFDNFVAYPLSCADLTASLVR